MSKIHPLKSAVKLARMRKELNDAFMERGELIDGALVALLSDNHVLILGPPGTAKSMLAEELCQRIEDANYFQWLLTRFSTPDEIFGAISLKSLEEDNYRRITTFKLPEAHVVFLDEIFKASSSILNTLLTVVNERLFHNGLKRVKVPLITMFGASNELPDEEELTALYDRFMLRFVVDYIEEEHHLRKMLNAQAIAVAERTCLRFDELNELRAAASQTLVGPMVVRALTALRADLARQEIIVSDRRWRNTIGVLRAHALLMGRQQVIKDDLLFLEHVLWKDPQERAKVRESLERLVKGYDGLKGYEEEARELLAQAQEVKEYAAREWKSEELHNGALIEAQTKIANILIKFEYLVREAADNDRAVAGVKSMRTQLGKIQQELGQ